MDKHYLGFHGPNSIFIITDEKHKTFHRGSAFEIQAFFILVA
jgi:hypothetical protein